MARRGDFAGATSADTTQFDPASPYFDPKSRPERPRWKLVDVKLVRSMIERDPAYSRLASRLLLNRMYGDVFGDETSVLLTFDRPAEK